MKVAMFMIPEDPVIGLKCSQRALPRTDTRPGAGARRSSEVQQRRRNTSKEFGI